MEETYILIPVSLIEARIRLAEKEETICKQYDFELAGQAARNRKSFYWMLLNDNNQYTKEQIKNKL